MTDLFDNLIWAYRALFSQTNAGGGTIKANFTVNERTIFLWGSIITSDYAADRNIYAYVLDEDDNIVQQVVFITPLDNERIPLFPASHAAAVTAQTVADRTNLLVLGKGDHLQVRADNLVQNETMTVSIRALIRSWPPTVTTTGSGGTVTTTVAYDKVI